MYDIIIIGGGPAGLSAAVYAKREALNAAVVESNNISAGQIAQSDRVDNYPGLYGESGFDMGEKFRKHAETLGAEFIGGEAEKIVPGDKTHTVVLYDGRKIEAKTLIYAAGTTPRKLKIKGEAELTGRGVSYCAVCDGAFYKGKTVTVVGGGDTALQDAVLLSKTAERVFLVHRRDEFRANGALKEKVKSTDNINLILNAVPTEIIGKNRVEAVKINQDGAEKTVMTDGIFIAAGTIPNSSLLKGIAGLDENGYVVAGESCVTSAGGIFAAGDVRTKRLRQVVTAVADGANSVISAEDYILLRQ